MDFIHRCQTSFAVTLWKGMPGLQTPSCNLSRGSAKLFTYWKWCGALLRLSLFYTPFLPNSSAKRALNFQMTVYRVMEWKRKWLCMFPSCHDQLSVSLFFLQFYRGCNSGMPHMWCQSFSPLDKNDLKLFAWPLCM